MTTPHHDARSRHREGTDDDAELRRDLELIAWLASEEGRGAVAELGSYDGREALAAVEALRARGVDPARASAAATQARLRTGARDRLGPWVDELLLTPDGAQQATRTVVADRHAARFAAAGVPRVADLGCGIGADSLALLRAGIGVLAVERDPVTAAVARANLERARALLADAGLAGGPAGAPAHRASSAQVPAAEVRTADALGVDLRVELRAGDGVFADPARRAGGRRLTDPEQWSPPLSAVLAWRGRTSSSGTPSTPGAAGGGRHLGVKVAPGIDHAAIPADMAAEWISVDGDLVEAGLWSPGLAPEGPGRHATILRTLAPGEAVAHRLREDTGAHPAATSPAVPVRFAPVRPLGALILEPDDAVLRAGLVAAVADMIPGAGLVGERLAYLTAETLTPQAAPFVRAYRVLEVLPQNVKRLRSALRLRDVGPLTIKRRATPLDPDVLRRKLALKGSRPATLVLAPLAGVPSAVLVEPVPLARP